jgi:FdhD protein
MSSEQWRFVDIVRTQVETESRAAAGGARVAAAIARWPRAEARDTVAVESPLQVLVNGEPFAVIMRTPGQDCELAMGFLFSEGLIASAADVDRLHTGPMANGRACVDASIPGVDVSAASAGGAGAGAAVAARRVTTNASCGMCGRVSVESLDVEFPAIELNWSVPPSVIVELPDRMKKAQAVFAQTGGLHAAGLFTPNGDLILMAEDVGRHNAVDKVIGRSLLDDGMPLDMKLLFVSGRTSYEIVQKACLAGLPLIAAVSAPSSLAVDLADRAGMTLLGFVREGRFNIYSHPERIADIT